MIVISNEDVPFPTPWNTNDPAIPNGTNIKKKQNIELLKSMKLPIRI